MHTDSIISPFEEQAKAYLSESRIKEIIFSRGTYHVHVEDMTTKDPAWAFFQIDENQSIKDFFCSCQSESSTPCEHLAAALLAIFSGHGEPLHKRFQHSFWYRITALFAKKYGYQTGLLTKKENQYQLKVEDKLLFSVTPKTKRATKFLKEWVDERQEETEETSLKFSNLPKKELILWKEGRPSEALRYELSFWSDLAKWLVVLQEQKSEYSTKFSYAKDFPKALDAHFEDLDLHFELGKESLLELIPFLSTIKTPLEVQHTPSVAIEKILYNQKDKVLSIHPKKLTTAQKKVEGQKLGDWIYLPKKGFYHHTDQSFTSKREVEAHHIEHELEKNTSFFHKHLKDTTLDPTPIHPKYLIHFDEHWNLHVHLYLFEPDDLSKPHSAFFGKWIYLEEKGFFRLKETTFQQPTLFIPRDKVTEFLRQYRYWINGQKGFEVHLAPVDTHISYKLNAHLQLIFSSELAHGKEKHYDFGEWIYIHGQGFYSKPRQSSPIQGGLTIEKNDIAKFIHLNQQDLESVPGFFANKCPLEKVSLALKADLDLQEIIIEPNYEFYPEYHNKHVLFFDHYSYVEQEGFYLLPKNLQLPKGFRKKVRIKPEDQTSFLAFQFKTLKPFITELDPCLQVPKELELALENFRGNQFNLIYENPIGKASIKELYKAIKNKQPYFLSPGGLIQLNHPRFSWIHDLDETQMQPDGIELTTLDLIRIEAIDSIFSKDPNSNKILSQVKAAHSLMLPSLKGFKTKLRPYQQVGLSWLWKLYMYDLSGILCDDMGLGKTHQAMALMACIKNQQIKRPYPGYKAPKKKFLIVCPTSVIYHWQDKLKEFFPGLKILTFYGLNRSLKRFQQHFDVVLTSYGILRIDQKPLQKLNFDLAIYDEVQVAKNHKSLTYKALQSIDSKMKLGLTGTPIENSLRELKALFDLIIPNYMPIEERFRDFFINPIERDQDEQKTHLLKQMITPFILRRKKEEVVKELPDKTEQVSHCELTKDQGDLYQDFLEQSRDKLLKDLQDESKAVPYMHVFALLNKLKQVCNHPKSLDPIKYADSTSGKWDLFVELLQEARESCHKVVIFTQYLNMMDLIEKHLKENNIGYASIRGSTKDRKTPLRRFEKDPTCEVFVGSLKAVGLGIDLTAASVVIHYDRWWNAARERQATDRVHRIGQRKGVLVFKLVTLNTLEEKIDQIISAKDRLMEEVVGTSDEDQVKSFSRQDLIDILQFVHKDVYTSS